MYSWINVSDLGKTSKAFFSLTVNCIDSRSGLCNSPGKALHVCVSGVALRLPVHEISDGTNKETNKQTDTHRIPVLLYRMYFFSITKAFKQPVQDQGNWVADVHACLFDDRGNTLHTEATNISCTEMTGLNVLIWANLDCCMLWLVKQCWL